MRSSFLLQGSAWCACALTCLGCSAEPDAGLPECTTLPETCSPLYPPTFDEVFTRTLVPTCGQADGVCHSVEHARGGLAFDATDPDAGYAALLEKDRVRPGDAACSEFIVRVHVTGRSGSMPPGTALSPEEACALRLWVEKGAER